MEQAYRDLIEAVKDFSMEYMDGIGEKRAFPSGEQLTALSRFDEPFPEAGTDAMSVIEQLHRVGSPATTA